MRVDIKHLIAKGATRQLVDKIRAYHQLMVQQGKPRERIIVQPAQLMSLMKLVSNQGFVVLCCGDAIVYHNHDPIDESAPEYKPKPRFDAGLPPVSANPFGLAAPAPKVKEPEPMPVYNINDGFDDDDIPF